MRRWRVGIVVGIVLAVGSILVAYRFSSRNAASPEYEPLAVSDEIRAKYERNDRELVDLGATGAALRYDQPDGAAALEVLKRAPDGVTPPDPELYVRAVDHIKRMPRFSSATGMTQPDVYPVLKT